MSVGIVTSVGRDAPLQALNGIQIVNIPTEYSTVFENIYTENGRKQTLHHQAALINYEHIPQLWRNAPIVHLAPIAQELDVKLAEQFPFSLVGVTPQGWMRGWDENGKVFATAWENSNQVLGRLWRVGEVAERLGGLLLERVALGGDDAQQAVERARVG